MKRVMAFAVIAALMACAPTLTAAPPGLFQPKRGVAVELRSAWTHIPPELNDVTTGSVLTRHGLALNRIDIIRLRPGQSIVRAPSYVEAPRFRTGMSEPELVGLVTASLQRLEYTDVRTENVRPHTLAGAPGVRFDIHGKYPSGLNLRGDAVLAQAHDELNLILFLAPAAHYYEASANEVEQIIQSARAN
jgi:hypothetical protein